MHILPPSLKNNHIVLTMVCTIIILYLVTLITLLKIDKTQGLNSGIIYLEDNFDRYNLKDLPFLDTVLAPILSQVVASLPISLSVLTYSFSFRDAQAYLIKIVTGSQPNAGTTAKVCVFTFIYFRLPAIRGEGYNKLEVFFIILFYRWISSCMEGVVRAMPAC